MNSKPLFRAPMMIGLVAACMWVGAQTGGMFRDRAGNMEVRQIKSWRIKPESKQRLLFKGIGAPKLIGVWKAQKMTIEAATLDAVVTADAKNAYTLTTATMGGGVEATIVRPTTKAGSNGTQTATVQSATATYDAVKQTIDGDGGVTLRNTDEAAVRTFFGKGNSGTVMLSETGSRDGAIRSASLKGNVDMEMRSTRQDGDSGKMVPYVLKGKADRLDYDAAARTIILTGHVKLSGDDPVLGADVIASKAVITLTASGEIDSVDFEGDPGQTVYRDGGGND